MKHTKGPWKYVDGKAAIISESEYLVPPDKDYEPDGIPLKVLDLYGAMGGTDTTADGLLIAAAPDLLKACKKARNVLMDSGVALLDDLLEAIAKAEGK